MAISQKTYIDVNSRFPEKSSQERLLGGLVFTQSEMLASAYADYKDVIEAYDDGELVSLNLGDVTKVFGGKTEDSDGSDEYKFSVRYYSYSSPSGQTPSALKFAKVLAGNFNPYKVGVSYPVTVNDVQNHLFVRDSTGKMTVYKVTTAVTASENSSISAIQAKLEEVSEGDVGSISKSYETPATALERVDGSDNSFGSFTFLGDCSDEELKEAAGTNEGFGTRYLDACAIEKGAKSASDVVAKKKAIVPSTEGSVFVLGDSKFSAAMPMSIFAATDYDNGDEAPCQMFKQFANETPTVFTDSDYGTLTKEFVNFYGQTQSNGKRVSFYQRGFNSDGTDTAIYCNEVWFKSRCITRLMDMFLGNEKVPANDEGMAMVRFRVAEVCDKAVSNGSFMSKSPSQADRDNVRNIVVRGGGSKSNADEILSGVENVGYGIWTFLGTDNGEYVIHYYVFYGTADSVRFVKGDDVMVR